MKKNLLLIGISCLLTLSACNKNNNSSSYNITGIEIAGPTSVLAGKSIQLTADVLGTDNDSVTWLSSDPNIATISNDGVVFGVGDGSVDITATSVLDTTKTATYTISVTLPKATEMSLFIENNANVSYNANEDIYTVNLGQTFYIDTLFPEYTKHPDINYTINYPSGTEENTVTLEIVPNTTRAKVISYGVYEGLTITATGKYSDLATENLKSTIEIDVIDKNIDKYNDVLDIVKSFKDKEISELVSSTLTRTKTTKSENNSTKIEEVLTQNSYLNATYVDNNIKTYYNGKLEKENTIHYYQGKNTLNSKNHYYTFKYDDNNDITEFYTPSKNDENISLIFDVHTSSITYGYYNILTNILSSDTNLYEGDIASFGNTYVYAYAEFEISGNNFKLISTCFDEDYGINYKVSLEVNYTQNTLNGYTFTEEIDNGSTVLTFSESLTNLIYDTKVYDSISNNDNYLDLNQYYLDDFEIIQYCEKDSNGAYDYSDISKYGAIEGYENGLVKYTTSYDKTIILKANALEPSTANVNFDNIKATSSDTTQIPNVTSITDGIFAINANKNDDGNSLPGKATFTFTSTKGVTKQVIIEFTKTILSAVNVTYGSEIPTYNEENDTYKFNPIFEGENSAYFFINSDPDEDIYTYNIDILEGDKEGIELFQYSDSNIYGCPGFSYAIKGLKVGTYKFQVYAVGYESIKDEHIFEITIEEPYSIEYISENIIGTSYQFKGSTSTYTFTFTNETTLTYEEVYGYGGSASTTFKYHIEKGAIIIDETQKFLNGMYFSRLSEGNVLFTKDFKTMNFYIEIYSSNQLEGTNFFTYNITFNKVYDPISVDNLENHLNGKTLIDDNGLISVSFNNGKGTLYFYNTNEELIATFTFNYAYNSSSKALVISNSTSTNSKYSLIDNKCEFDSYNQALIFRINNNEYNFYDNYKVSIHQ